MYMDVTDNILVYNANRKCIECQPEVSIDICRMSTENRFTFVECQPEMFIEIC